MKLSLLQWNAQSLRAHSNELRQFIATTGEKPHLICVQETWLQPRLEFRFPGYSWRGGIAPAAAGAELRC